jgi:hypothetical protein
MGPTMYFLLSSQDYNEDLGIYPINILLIGFYAVTTTDKNLCLQE